MTTTAETDKRLLRLVANTLRFLAVDTVQKANSGHPGLPMGMADVATVLWGRFLKHDPQHPRWPDRDRFVLSGGHGSALLYALLHVSGYDLALDELKQFRQLGSRTPGHPEHGLTPGVETTTGPLGQGLANAVGMAMAERWLAARFNLPGHLVVDHATYCFCGDGDLMEGISHEVGALAGHLGLGKLTVFFDDNGITIDGPTKLSTSEEVLERFAAYGWHTQRIDGHDTAAIERAVLAAQGDKQRPSLIACRTHIGYGSPHKQDTAHAHGEPLGEDEVRLTKKELGWPETESFRIPDEARAYLQAAARFGAEAREVWEQTFAQFALAHPKLAATFEAEQAKRLSEGWQKAMPEFDPKAPIATRAASGAVITALSQVLPNLVGGSADLTPSNNTRPRSSEALRRDDFSGRYVHFGIRELGMGGVLNGMALHGGLVVYGGTFLVFSDYMRPAIRLAALMELPVIYVFTHDSIGLGEDGPTHQAVEQLMALRAMPHLAVMRPADPTETAALWGVAIVRGGPSALCLTRQQVPTFDGALFQAARDGAALGGYVLSDVDTPQVLLIGTGSEVHLALAAQATLRDAGIAARVVSMPCWSLFELQPQSYRDGVLPPSLRARVAVEAGVAQGWERYVGLDGAVVGMHGFGASAPAKQLFSHFGITAAAVVEQAKAVVARAR